MSLTTRTLSTSPWTARSQTDLSDTFSVQPLDAATVHAARLTSSPIPSIASSSAASSVSCAWLATVAVAWEVAG